MLEIYILFEQGNTEQALQSIQNFRKSPHYRGSEFFKLGTGLVNRLISRPEELHHRILHEFQRKYLLLKANPLNESSFGYFDALIWIKAKLGNTTMMVEFRNRRQKGEEGSSATG